MLRKIADSIADILARAGCIADEDRKLYSYAAYNILFKAVPIMTLIVMSVCMGRVIENLIIMSVFLSLRKYTGGFHFDTPVMCLISSTAIMAILLLSSGYINPSWWMWIVLAVSVIIISILSPIDSDKRKLDASEKKEYKKNAVIIISVLIIIYVYLIRNSKNIYANCIFMGIELATVLQLIDAVKSKITK